MIKKTIIPALITIIIVLTNCGTSNTMLNTKTVDTFDINKYLGVWYEIARFPHSFEKDLVGVTATYSLRNDGKIKVVNQGYKNTLQGELKKAEGKAKIADKSVPSKLKVSFFWFFYADYNIMELDTENYQWVLVGSSSDNYLWILSRTPQMNDETYNMLVEKAKNRGYDVSKLYKVPQKVQ